LRSILDPKTNLLHPQRNPKTNLQSVRLCESR
jgi:hypothetical protein